MVNRNLLTLTLASLLLLLLLRTRLETIAPSDRLQDAVTKLQEREDCASSGGEGWVDFEAAEPRGSCDAAASTRAVEAMVDRLETEHAST